MPGTVAMAFLISLATLARVSRSLPKTLTEFSPFTPEAASWTLSWMYCEKLNSTPGNGLLQGVVDFGDQLFLVMSRCAIVERLERHEELGVEEAGRIGAVVRPAVLGDHGLGLGKALDQLAACG